VIKIAFFVQHMLCGGVESSLLNLINVLPDNEYDVTCFVISRKGDFIKKAERVTTLREIPMPQKVRSAIPIGGTKIAVREAVNRKCYLKASQYLLKHICNKDSFAELSINFNNIPTLSEQYDIAICYHMHSPFLVKYVVEKVNANKKIAWIHNDFTTTGYKITGLKKYISQYSIFLAVSEKLTEEFIHIFPEFKNKVFVMHNIVPVEEIHKKSLEYYPSEFQGIENCLKIITVGRLEYQKGIDIAIEVCSSLRQRIQNFHWFVLGEGSERKNLEKLIKKNNLQGFFSLLGNKINPYPYYSNCDIYVQTSRHEGWGIAVTEAKAFCKPIVCTDFAGAREQIENEYNGFITNLKVDELENKIEILMKSVRIREKFQKNSVTVYDSDAKSQLLSIFK